MCTHIQTDRHTSTHIHAHMHTQTHIQYSCTHAHIHTYTHIQHMSAHTNTHLIIEFDEQWNLLCLDKGYNGFSVKLSIICGSPVIKLSQTRCAYSTSAVTDELEHTHCISSR